MRRPRRFSSILALLALAAAPLAAAKPSAKPSAKAAEKSADTEKPKSPMNAASFSGLELRAIGPALMSGRIADLAIDPRSSDVRYVAVASGGVWKATNAGTTWEPLFEHQDTYSIGCITLDPTNPDVVWVGSGENDAARHIGWGDGVYVSRDGGAHWEHRGLEHSEHISKIVVDPRDPDTV